MAEVHIGNLLEDNSTLEKDYFLGYARPGLGYEFERIDMKPWREFVLRTWAWPFFAAIIYLALIFGLERYMKNRPPFKLRTPLILWNGTLGVFSIIGFVRVFPTLAKLSSTLDGLYDCICTQGRNEPQIVFWALAFAISKYVELGDTIFIVLRKRPLQLLQWYHHVATLIVCWTTSPYAEPVARWFMAMNYGVHSVMYPYFALKMAGIHIPKRIANMITTAQFTQMITGFLLNVVTIGLKVMGFSCYRHPFCIGTTVTIYATFVILFGKLFVDSVIKTNEQKKHAKTL